MSSEKQAPRLLIVDTVLDAPYLPYFRESALRMGWVTNPFTWLSAAAEEFDPSVDAAAFALNRGGSRTNPFAKQLQKHLDENSIPRAIVETGVGARRWIRSDTPQDLLLPPGATQAITRHLSTWLLGVAARL